MKTKKFISGIEKGAVAMLSSKLTKQIFAGRFRYVVVVYHLHFTTILGNGHYKLLQVLLKF